MSPGLATFSLPIVDLLADPFLFSVPVYQRPYSWTPKEAGQLLDDVLAASGVENPESAEPDYFLGSILLLSGRPGDPRRDRAPAVFEIVDGQQRLVTLAILASALRDLESVESEAMQREIEPLLLPSGATPQGRSSGFRIELRGKQRAFLESCILAEGACSVMPEEEALGEAERRILEIREQFITELSELTAEQCLALARYLKTSCYFVVMLTQDIDRAHRMFLVLNGRGKPLSRHDILKAEILNNVPQQNADRALAAWDAIAGRLDDNSFESFFSHLHAIHGHYRMQVIAGIRSIIDEVGGATAFIEQVFEPLASAYHQVLNPGINGSKADTSLIRRSLTYLHRLSGSDWVPAAMVAFQRHGGDPERLAEEIGEIERFAHVLRLMCLGSGKRQRRFADVIEVLRAGRRLREGESPCRINRDERRTISYNLRDLHGRNPQVCKLVLLRLNDELSGRQAELDPADFSIEHVLPQRTGQTSPWRETFKDGEERDLCIRSLGNLLLVTQSQNDRARNKEFARKKEIYAETRGTALEPLTADVLAAVHWGSAEVRAREMRLLQLLERTWNLELVREQPGPVASRTRRRGGRRGDD